MCNRLTLIVESIIREEQFLKRLNSIVCSYFIYIFEINICNPTQNLLIKNLSLSCKFGWQHTRQIVFWERLIAAKKRKRLLDFVTGIFFLVARSGMQFYIYF